MTEAERDAFRAEIRSYLLDNPEVIVEAINLLEDRQAAAQANEDAEMVRANSEALFNDGYSWVGGNPDGDVTLVEFMDYRCGFCRRAVPEIKALLAADTNIRLVIKEFPILGEASMLSSRFAIATHQIAGDAAYEQVHDALIDFSGDLNEVTLLRLADSFGLDGEAILAQMDSDEVTEIISKNRKLAQDLRINGTPTFVLGDQMLRGFLPAEQMAALIDELRG
jgi:protein-disulfide isomerase